MFCLQSKKIQMIKVKLMHFFLCVFLFFVYAVFIGCDVFLMCVCLFFVYAVFIGCAVFLCVCFVLIIFFGVFCLLCIIGWLQYKKQWLNEADATIIESIVAPSTYIYALLNICLNEWGQIDLSVFPDSLQGVDKVFVESFSLAFRKKLWTKDKTFPKTMAAITTKHDSWIEAIKSESEMKEDDAKVEIEAQIKSLFWGVLTKNRESLLTVIEEEMANWGVQFINDLLPCYRHMFGMLGKRIFGENHGVIKFLREYNKKGYKDITQTKWDALWELQTEMESTAESKTNIFAMPNVHFKYGEFVTDRDTFVGVTKAGNVSDYIKLFMDKSYVYFLYLLCVFAFFVCFVFCFLCLFYLFVVYVCFICLLFCSLEIRCKFKSCTKYVHFFILYSSIR